MIGPLIDAVKALIEAVDDRAGAILPGAATLTVKASGPGPVLATAPLGGPAPGLLTGLSGPLPNPCKLTLSGKVQIGADLASPPKPTSLRVRVDFPPSANQAVKSSTGESGPPATDGTWELSCTLFFYDQLPRDTLAGTVTIDPTTVPVRPQSVQLDNAWFGWFMDAYDREEAKAMAAGLKDRRVFLARVRKVVQTVPAFDFVIGQTRGEPPVYPLLSDAAERWHAGDSVVADGQRIRLSHVGTAIEGAPRQAPRLALPPRLQNLDGVITPFIGDLVSWGGDLASAISTMLLQHKFPPPYGGTPAYPTLAGYLAELASEDQLRADLDGVILGTRYDPSRSLTANVRPYYGKDSRKRYSLFIDAEQDRLGNKPIRLQPPAGSPPRLTSASLDFIAQVVSACAKLLLGGKLFFSSWGWGPFPAGVDAALEPGSAEVLTAANYFADFLERGLAAE